MALSISGEEVVRIRQALGLSVSHFATILGVHPSTVHRWENAGNHQIPVDGVAANVLVACRQRVIAQKMRKKDSMEIGTTVAQALLLGGALVALGLLIQHLTGED